jgi:ABC-2 type transport system ATP-binding protein
LGEKIDVPSGRLSGGMKRRLMIARALVHDPQVLILDEPTAGVDISLRRSMWEFIKKQNELGMTIILTTHYLEEAESLCKNIAIIDQGNIIENDSTDHLLHKLNRETYILYCETVDDISTVKFNVKKVDKNTLEVYLKESELISDLMEDLRTKGIIVKRVKNKVNRLEELFVNLVQRSHLNA